MMQSYKYFPQTSTFSEMMRSYKYFPPNLHF